MKKKEAGKQVDPLRVNDSRENPGRISPAKRSFSKEFRDDVVWQVTEGKKPVAQAAREYDIGANLIHRWKKLYSASGQGAASNEENARLAKELAVVTMERDILKKALAIFSKPTK
jgi:transposase